MRIHIHVTTKFESGIENYIGILGRICIGINNYDELTVIYLLFNFSL